MMNTHSNFQRNRSFDASSQMSEHHIRTSRQSLGGSETVDNTLRGLSSLMLQETPDRWSQGSSIPNQRIRSIQVMSPMSPLSDRSIEPMSVSDISNGDLDHMDEDDMSVSGTSLSKLSQSVVASVDNSDTKSMKSLDDDTDWLWSIGMRKNVNVDSESVTTATNNNVSENQTLTQRIPNSSLLRRASSMPASMYEKDHIEHQTAKKSRKHTRIMTNSQPRSERNCCSRCLRVLNCTVVLSVVVALVVLSNKDFRQSWCTHQRFNLTALQEDLEENIFGQHIAIKTVYESLAMLLSSPEKNITTLSFHGWTGIGKNFVSSFVSKQVEHKHVHKIIIPLDFAHTKDDDNQEERMFQNFVDHIPDCGVILFIVDEVDKASPQAIMGLQSALNNLTHRVLIDVKVIVLLLSNSGGSAINRYFLDQLSAGKSRESIQRPEVVNFMLKVNGAQIAHEWFIPLLEGKLIDSIVPFLPLEKSHTASCIKRYITETRPMLGHFDVEQIVERVLEQMTFFPQRLGLFSSTGCRGVTLKVDLTVD